MGMFDSVMIPCKCGNQIEFQSKGGDCTLAHYTVDNAPLEVLADADRHGSIASCEYCNASVELYKNTRQFVFIYEGNGGKLGKALEALDAAWEEFPNRGELMRSKDYDLVHAVVKAWREKKDMIR